MGITSKFKRAPLSAIKVDRAKRQRTNLELEADGLAESIRRIGVLNPIIVEETDEDGIYALIAGERRYSISVALNLKDIPIRLATELTVFERKFLELEENIRRTDLHWKDQVRSVAEMHELLQQQRGEDWSQTDTGLEIGYSPTTINMIMRVFRDFEAPAVQNASGMREAYNLLSRRDERASEDAFNEIMEATQSSVAKATGEGPRTTSGEPAPVASRPSPEDTILQRDFLTWAPSYSGSRFNFIHCDFPYGIKVFSGPQSGKHRHEVGADGASAYSDNPEIYWALIEGLCKHLDRLMAPSGHLMFWLTADIKIMSRTLAEFNRLAPGLVFQGKPIVWHKTDNVGVLSDAQRGPRHIYEVALLASREDRKIIKAVSDTYGAPTNKEYHPSTKPVPVLRHFFQMFVDSNTKILDPTCGSGAALRAAESMDCGSSLGLELDESHCAAARSALRKDRLLRSASR